MPRSKMGLVLSIVVMLRPDKAKRAVRFCQDQPGDFFMINIEEYIKLTKEERQKHLNLQEICIERGGHSRDFRGLLAYILNTTIPSGSKIQLCHACHNEKCSNPKHLYWGTIGENTQDAINNGTRRTFYQCTVDKYGETEARRMYSRNGSVRRLRCHK